MANYKILRINISNFKLVTQSNPLEIDFKGKAATILNGPNGYGKTTVFDALELLITGSLAHFRDNLPNTRKESISVLANNPEHDLIITGEFQNDSRRFSIRRNFLATATSPYEQSEIRITENDIVRLIDQNDVYKIFNINKSMFDLGIYISQSNSLEFLQLRYKDRKKKLSDILNDPFDLNKVEYVKKLKDAIDEKCKEKLALIDNCITKLQDAIDLTKSNIASDTQNMGQLSTEYTKLFSDQDYDFDEKTIDVNKKKYDDLESELSLIEKFIGSYEDFINTRFNTILDTLNQSFNESFYKALYFKQCIGYKKQQAELFDNLCKANNVISQYDKGEFSVDVEVFKLAGIPDNRIEVAMQLIEEMRVCTSQLDGGGKALAALIERRNQFIHSYNISLETGILDKGKCPLCGNENEMLDDLILQTETYLNGSSKFFKDKVAANKNNLVELYKKSIVPQLKDYIVNENELWTIGKLLKEYEKIDTTRLEEALTKLNLAFPTISVDEFNFEQIQKFDEIYADFNEHNGNLIKPVKSDVPKDLYEQFRSISTKYYLGMEPKHTVNDIQNKKKYISDFYTHENLLATQRNSDLLSEYISLKNNVSEKSEKLKKEISNLYSIYIDAQKEQQGSIAKAIQIPLFIYSGKILQNYPMGVGINVQVKESQIVFNSGISDQDIFNLLSAGQLNGLVISILLSVKSVYAKDKSIGFLLIDDPLQSIDDISAISLIDLLLTQFGNEQVILSTHEEDKTHLINSKYHAWGKSINTCNLHQIYLKG